ncbi:hypothetical protein AMJ85_04425 [candidate division BRC1 bacterium SM23_51]|nr:MAG: hypothetical protein AMJ85_04425 [candidate division BRC1 bacterium SM23_51]
MRFLTIAVRDLRRRPLRSFLTSLGIAAAVGSFVAFVGMSRGVGRAIVNRHLAGGTHAVAFPKGTIGILAASADESLAEQLRQIDGVAAVAAELIDLVAVETGYVALLSGLAPGSYLWQSLHLHDGKLPGADEPKGVVLGEAIADTLGKRPGDTVEIRGEEFLVTGVARQSGVIANSTIVLHLPAMQELLRRQGKVTIFNLRLDHPDDPEKVAAVKARLAEAFVGLAFNETDEVAEKDEMLQMLRAIAWSISVIALVMAAVVMLNTLIMSVVERTREIGVLSAVGWQAGRILAMIVLEGVVLTAIGGVVGILLGIGGLHCLASLPPVRGLIDPEVTLRLVLEVCGAALLFGVLGSLYPAWRAVTLDPVDALRYE